MKEETLLLGNQNSLVGILTVPDNPPKAELPAVILLNAGLIHRIGPNRIYVKLARHLAKLGFTVLRFDLSGIGDSKPRHDNLPFEKSAVDDTRQAMDYLTQRAGTKTFVLMGHCAGAFNSFATASVDSRVSGTVLINPEGANDDWVDFDRKRKESQYYQSYYSRGVLTSGSRWKKFFTGQVSYSSILRNLVVNIFWNKLSTLFFRLRKKIGNEAEEKIKKDTITGLQTVTGRGTRILFVYSEGSTGFLRLQGLFKQELKALNADGKVQLEIIPNADHVFTLTGMQTALSDVIGKWMGTSKSA